MGFVPVDRKPQGKDEWEQQEAAERADEAKLAKRNDNLRRLLTAALSR
jgi:hypothetical protein